MYIIVRQRNGKLAGASYYMLKLNKLPSIKDRGQTDRVAVLVNLYPIILTFSNWLAMVMTHSHA